MVKIGIVNKLIKIIREHSPWILQLKQNNSNKKYLTTVIKHVKDSNNF